MKPVLIITRPEPDGSRFAGLVQGAVDIEVMLSPLLEIVPLEAKCTSNAYIFTSTNGVAQTKRLGLRGVRAWCVGDRTAEMARAAGYDSISARGTVEDLISLILAQKPQGAIAHIRGKEARGDLGPRLRAAGIKCSDVIAYEQRPLPLSPEVKAKIEGGDPVIIPLFSPKSAALLVEQTRIGPNAVLLAMSEAVAKVFPAGRAHVVSEPNGLAMLNAVIAQCRGAKRAK